MHQTNVPNNRVPTQLSTLAAPDAPTKPAPARPAQQSNLPERSRSLNRDSQCVHSPPQTRRPVRALGQGHPHALPPNRVVKKDLLLRISIV